MSRTLTKTQPSPNAEAELRRKFRQCYRRIAEDDLVKPLEVNKHVRNIPLLRMIGDVSGNKVLDVGSSQGLLLDELKGPALTICVDLAEAYLRVAREHGHQAVVADGEALPFQADTFDVVICSDVLEHVLDVEAVIKQVRRVLKPEGTFFALVPWEEDLGKYKAFEGTYEFTHLRSFDNETVRKFFHGFRIVRRRGVAPNVVRPPHLKILDALPGFVQGLFRLAGVDSLEEWFGRHLPWRIRNRYWKWYWRQLEQFPERDWLWLRFYPPAHMLFKLAPAGTKTPGRSSHE